MRDHDLDAALIVHTLWWCALLGNLLLVVLCCAIFVVVQNNTLTLYIIALPWYSFYLFLQDLCYSDAIIPLICIIVIRLN